MYVKAMLAPCLKAISQPSPPLHFYGAHSLHNIGYAGFDPEYALQMMLL
jgi:hypothetical protein